MAIEKYYLIVNVGSASKKYALYQGEERKFFAHIEKEKESYVVNINSLDRNEKRIVTDAELADSLKYVLEIVSDFGIMKIPSVELAAVGFRVVAPGTFFLKHGLLDDEYFKKLKLESEEAPLHILSIINELENLKRLLPNILVVGVSDSAFHSTIPESAHTYAISYEVAEKNDIRKFGYHGSSFASVVRKVEKMSGNLPSKIIICHLGSGSSIAAIKDGKCIDTSMGMTPLEGVPMATRVGDIDPGAVIYLCQKLRLTPGELEQYFYTKCGLLGMSGKSNDIRELFSLEAQGDVRVKLALDVLVARIKNYIGSYIATLNGLDMLIFSATIGERSFVMRERICRNMNALGIVLDDEKNNATVSCDGFIHKDGGVSVAVITTDEMGEIAYQTQKLLESNS
ncbi:MAG: acetate/propionate family kinase [Candidatus Taylorbacteria bacterium]|nr:acetate/propionate family kinase [Candidatus Taylorbacteria bacterium]